MVYIDENDPIPEIKTDVKNDINSNTNNISENKESTKPSTANKNVFVKFALRLY